MEATHLARNVTCGMSMAGVGQIFKVRHEAGRATFWGPSSHRMFDLDQLVTVDVPTGSDAAGLAGALD